MNIAYLGLGSNLSNRKMLIHQAIILISEMIGEVTSMSSIYESEPWGFEEQESFLNQVIRVKTPFTADQVLQTIKGIEYQLGRTVVKRYGPRTIDVDILFFNDAIITSRELSVPHPKIEERNFVLIPLLEIASEYTHPASGKSVRQMMADCKDEGKVKLLSPENLGNTI